MKQILVLGAGQSSPYLISYLLEHAQQYDWFVTVGDLDLGLAKKRVANHSRGNAIFFDIHDGDMLSTLVKRSDLVVQMLPPAFQHQIAWECVHHGTHLITVSYRDQELRDLESDAIRHGVLILTEMGLDPGIDHMSAMEIINRVHDQGGRVTSFCSYGSGIPAPDSLVNPLRYIITWNPRNVVMSAEKGAQFLENGKIKIMPWHHVFQRTWPVDVEGIGTLEAYPNRDSMSYQKLFGLKHCHTMIRGTLRWPGWSETWSQIIKLGLPNESLRIPNLKDRTYREVIEMFLPHASSEASLESRAANWLNISPTGQIMQNLKWLGLFSEEKTDCDGETAAEMMAHLLKKKLPLTADIRDMVVILHKIKVEYPDENNHAAEITSTFVEMGEKNNGFTAMAKTVGLPAAIAVKLILTGDLPMTGSYIPTHPAIYTPVMKELREAGFVFKEQVVSLK